MYQDKDKQFIHILHIFTAFSHILLFSEINIYLAARLNHFVNFQFLPLALPENVDT